MQKENQLKSNYNAPLYSAFARATSTAMTNRADRFSRSVIPQGFYAGYSERNVKAFTLIELLVVVLIIGILAAVAVPQYQKAVWKSRYVQAKTLAKSIANAEEVYYLANGYYTPNFEELSIEIPTPINVKCSSADTVGGDYCRASFSWGDCAIVTNTPGRNDIECTLQKNGSNFLQYYADFDNVPYTKQTLCLAWGEKAARKPVSTDISYQVCANETNHNAPTGDSGGAVDYWKY